MSLDQTVLPPLSPHQYAPERAQALALRYASAEPGTSLRELHEADPDAFPPPLIVRRWRRTWPAFDALMIEAEAARAEAWMEETVELADTSRKAANTKNSIAARWRMAEALDPVRWGQRRILAGDSAMPLRVGAAANLSDEELAAIARGVDPAALLENDAPAMLTGPTPHAPPVQSGGGLRRGDEGGHVPTALPASEYSTGGSRESGSIREKIPEIFEGELGVVRRGFERDASGRLRLVCHTEISREAGASAEGVGSDREVTPMAELQARASARTLDPVYGDLEGLGNELD